MTTKRAIHPFPDGESIDVQVERTDTGFRVIGDSPAFEADVEPRDNAAWSVLTGTGSYETQVRCEDGKIQVLVGGERFTFWQGRQGAGTAGSETAKREPARTDVKAPMPGKVVKLLVAVGDVVTAGQGVLLFEAMKMQNELKSPQDGTVGELLVVEGQAVEARDRLFVIRRN